jgi:tetratricopeptide (TPR) repeat protein
LNSLLFSNI